MSMNEEEFARFLSRLESLELDWAVDELRARDTAQREALARVEADNRQLQLIVNSHANMRDTAQAQLAEAVGLLSDSLGTIDTSPGYPCGVEIADRIEAFLAQHAQHAQAEQQEAREPVLARPEHGVTLDKALGLTMDRYSGALDKLAAIEQQEAQGAQAGDERAAFEDEFDRRGFELDRLPSGAYLIPAVRFGWEGWEARAALATQPAAGEPEQQTAINADDLPTKKYPLAAFDFDAPVAAGEPVAWIHEDELPEGYPYDAMFPFSKVDFVRMFPVFGPPAAGEPIHQWADQDLWMDGDEADMASARAEGFKTRTLWTAPPAAAHGDQAVRKDAERYRWLREQEAEHGVSVVNVGSWPLAATCIALTYPDAESVDRAIDAAMRAQAGEGGE